MAFRKGTRYGHKQNAFYHAHTLYGLSLDLKDFFPSIAANKVYNVFSSIGYNNFAATILTNLCTLDGELPQGSACSPAISNIVCITLDKRFVGLCEKRGIRYTRYADDMYFSCDDKSLLLKIFSTIERIIESEDFVINKTKTHFHNPSNKKQITGITISSTDGFNATELKAPRKFKQTIRAEIYTCIVSGVYTNKQHVLGEIAYVCYIEKENKNTYLERIKSYIDNLTNKIQIFPELVEAYNSNKFFNDSKPVVPTEVCIDTEDDFESLEFLFQSRRQFLEKNGLEDICKYSNWPDAIVNASQYATEDSSFSECPF